MSKWWMLRAHPGPFDPGPGVPAGHLSLCDESFPVCRFYVNLMVTAVRGVSHSPIFGASCLTQNVVSHNRSVWLHRQVRVTFVTPLIINNHSGCPRKRMAKSRWSKAACDDTQDQYLSQETKFWVDKNAAWCVVVLLFKLWRMKYNII